MDRTEVQYDRMRPGQIVEAREAHPVAYLPIGTIEWHGPHAPVGLDAIKAHALAIRCARAGGGLVFPPLWYGESREEGLMEANSAERHQIAESLGLSPSNFAPGYMRFPPQQQYEHYQHLLLHCLFQIQSLGFKAAVLVAGHYPLIDHARAACSLYHQCRFDNRRARLITWAFTGYELVRDEFPDAGDHAGFWETSLLLALVPELVDLSQLPSDPQQKPVGVITSRPIREANAEYGEKAIGLIVDRVTRQVTARLRNPQLYYEHGLRF
ncbi:MAG: creatininase family protein [Phycisphaerae bacterium]|jgi:creatinine amidohydrolase